MKLVRVEHGGAARWGRIEGDEIVVCAGTPFEDNMEELARIPISGAALLPPAEPTKIIAVGVNYADHAREMGNEIHEDPILFLKPPSSLLPPDGEIVRPEGCKQLDYEAELALVIGKRCKNITASESAQYILGFTCCNDVTARDIQRRDGQWARGKGYDTFCPLGPWLETEYDWRDKNVKAVLEGQVKQNGQTADMLTKVDEIVAYASRAMTLMPGDIITTGTPEGVGPMQEGDTIEITVEGIGTLRNTIYKG